MRKRVFSWLLFVLLPGASLGLGYGAWAYFSVPVDAPALRESEGLAPDEAVEVAFSVPVATADYAQKVKIAPSAAARLEWKDEGKILSIAPKATWKFGQRYTISLPEAQAKNFKAVPAARLSFVVEPLPQVVSVTPENGAKDVMLGIEDPITVKLDRSAEHVFVKFQLDPEEDTAYEINPERTEFKLMPKTPVKDGQSYRLSVFARYRHADDGAYVKIYESSFETKPAFVEWAKDFSERLEQARRYTKPRITEGKYIDINLETQVMTTFEDGRLLDAHLISSGKRGMNTPEGTFALRNKAPRPWSKRYSLYMPYWMALTADGKYGIHELPEWPGGYKEGQNHLGTPVSHGCVRLGVGSAKTVYEWAEVGTPVVIYR